MVALPSEGADCKVWASNELRTVSSLRACQLLGESIMKPRITLITLGVDNLATSLTFYRDGLGLKTDGIIGTEFGYGAVVFFDLDQGA